MPHPAPLPDGLGHDFTVRAAAEFGVTRPRTRRSDLVSPFHGTRSRTTPQTTSELVAAYLPRLPEHGFFSHTTAAALWGLPLPTPGDSVPLHVSYPHRRRPARTRGVSGHHLVIRPDEVTLLAGIPLTSPERTWCDLAGVLGFEALVAAGDRVIWHRDPLASLAAVADMARRHPDRRHRTLRDAALASLSDRCDSPPETRLRLRFTRAGLPRFDVNQDLLDAAGAFLGRPDISFPDYRELVDYEGDGHRTDRDQWLRDVARVPRFEGAGWHTHRATSLDLPNGSRSLILRVAATLRAKGWPGEPQL